MGCSLPWAIPRHNTSLLSSRAVVEPRPKVLIHFEPIQKAILLLCEYSTLSYPQFRFVGHHFMWYPVPKDVHTCRSLPLEISSPFPWPNNNAANSCDLYLKADILLTAWGSILWFVLLSRFTPVVALVYHSGIKLCCGSFWGCGNCCSFASGAGVMSVDDGGVDWSWLFCGLGVATGEGCGHMRRWDHRRGNGSARASVHAQHMLRPRQWGGLLVRLDSNRFLGLVGSGNRLPIRHVTSDSFEWSRKSLVH